MRAQKTLESKNRPIWGRILPYFVVYKKSKCPSCVIYITGRVRTMVIPSHFDLVDLEELRQKQRQEKERHTMPWNWFVIPQSTIKRAPTGTPSTLALLSSDTSSYTKASKTPAGRCKHPNSSGDRDYNQNCVNWILNRQSIIVKIDVAHSAVSLVDVEYCS